jgi:predicted metalloendopeptidase
MGSIRLTTTWRSTLLTVVLCWGPGSLARAQTVDARRTATAEAGVDSSIRPGDDFFGYANGAWLRSTTIPADKDRWNARTEINELTRRQVDALLDDVEAAPMGSTERKVVDFRAAYLNEAAMEARGVAPLKPILDSITHLHSKADLTRYLGRGLRADVDPLNWAVYRSSWLLGLSVEPGIHGEPTNMAFLLQGGLGLTDREHYLSTEPRMQAQRVQYQQYIGRLLGLAGLDRAAQRAATVMALETSLAQTQATREASANDRNADHVWTRTDFARKAPGMDWSAFFDAAGLARQETFVAWQPTAVTGVAALVASQPLEAWKDYLRFHALNEFADVLPPAFAEAAMAMRASVTSQAQPVSRAQRARDATQLAMSDALGRMYAERHFPAEQKARVEAIAANVIAAFRQRVEAATWMSPGTRTQALAKLQSLYFGIGYPETWQDYSDLMVDPMDPVGNLRRVADRQYRRALARLGRPVDATEWWIAPQTVGAVLIFQQNAYNFPAALLQTPKFDPAASDAANYGAIGAIIGHEVSHFVDLLGAEWDTERRLRRWWTPEDLSQFQVAADALANQVAGYEPLPDLVIDGRLTQTENIADLGGLAAAFDAHRRSLGERVTDSAFVRQQDREFFIGFARSWRGKSREESLRAQLASDHHAPERYRIATVRNIDAWYEAFDVRPGQRLYLEPGARVRIW